ncbi:MAG: response regulator transcription factor [Actinomycetota bacterium]|nr:response regulator transcription factor [Actinomycetota bacterium]
MIRILVTEDHTVLRTGLAALLEREEDMTAVGQAATADQAVIKARDLQPDVILLDVVMPRKSGFDALPELRKVAPEARVIMLSMQTSSSSIRQALISGAAGYVAKHASETDLLDAIRRVAAGSRYVDPELGGDLVVSDAAALTEPISERERDVLVLLTLGYTNQEIAAMLFISVRTVETHRAHIMQKLDLKTRAELVLYALAKGLIGPN